MRNMIKNADTMRGTNTIANGEWKYYTLEDAKRNIVDLDVDLPPVEWKLNHLPVEAKEKFTYLIQKLREENLTSLTILVMGLSGVGKSSTINSLIGHDVFAVNEFKASQDILIWSGLIDNVTIRIIDTPGFLHCGIVHPKFSEVLEWFSRKCRIDILLCVDRLDEKWRSGVDISYFLQSRMFNQTVIVLTHGQSPLLPQQQFESSVLMRWRELKFSILSVTRFLQEVVEDYALQYVVVENSAKCPRINGEKILPDGSRWLTRLVEVLCDLSLTAISSRQRIIISDPRMFVVESVEQINVRIGCYSEKGQE